MNTMMNAVLWSKNDCQWCDRVRQLFHSINIDYIEYKYDIDFNKKSFYGEFGEGATFPQVQIQGRHIGGCKETLKWLQEQKLI
tara:strand:+ start:209 stop:457 length:249 start_codon:yes stop_codon:yes gene_type:complete